MKIKGYTSAISPERSLEAIDSLLRQAGATHTGRTYHEAQVSAVMFQLNVNGKIFAFKLPADPAAVEKILMSEVRRPVKGTAERIREQALRTAWSLVRDWVHIQLSMIRLQQVEPLEVFLPYLYDGQTDRTFYNRLKDGGFKQLPQGVST